MKANFDQVVDRRGTNCAKFDEMDQLYGPGLMHLGVADMDFVSPKPVTDAMDSIVKKGVFGYTILPNDYKELVYTYLKRRYQVEIDPSWVVFSPRINMALNMAVETFTNKGDGIILHTPAYTALQNAVTKYERYLIDCPLQLENGRFFMDFNQLHDKVAEAKKEGIPVKMMLLCNPHNPTGRVWEKEELKKVADFCKEEGLLLISDEIHSDFIKKGYQFTSMLSFAEELKEQLIVCNSVTKTLNVPGVILSNAVIPGEKIRKAFEETVDRWGLHNPNIFAAGILRPAYLECDSWVEEVNEYIEDNYHFLEKFFHDNLPLFDIYFSEGTYMAWIGFHRLAMTPEEVERRLIEQGKVSVYMGDRYGKETKYFIRINVATSREYLKEALERFKNAFD